MRTVTKRFYKQLELQAKEANLQGLTSIAEALSDQISKNANATRDNNEFYSYSEDLFIKDIEKSLWDAVVRTADFYDIRRLDARDVEPLIKATATDMIKEICSKYGIVHGVGAHQELVPGEIDNQTIIEVEE